MPKNKILNSKRPNLSGLLTYAGLGSASLLASLPVFLTLGPVFSSPNVSAEDAAGASNNGIATVSVGSALAITAQDITISASPTVGNSFYTATSTVNVKNTGSSGGYHLIMSSNNSGSLKNGTKSINTFADYSKTGTDMKNAGESSWGYTMQSVSGTNSTPAENKGADFVNIYYPVPTNDTAWGETAEEGTKYAFLKNTTDYTNTTAGDNTTIGFGFAIGPDTVAGTYTDTITYTAIANKDNRTLFDMRNMQDLAKYPLACANTPTPAVRTGDTPDTAVTATTDSLAGYSVGQGNIDKIPTVSLKDTRDDNSYEVRKLADGNCWMTTSLKIGKSTDTTLAPTDSNVSANFTLHAVKTAVNQTANSTTVDYVFTGGANGTYLYNFYAATAGKGGVLGEDNPSNNSAEDSSDDICPRGWHLPSYDGNASWNKLLRVDQGVYEVATDGDTYSSNKVSWGTAAAVKTASSNPVGLQTTSLFRDSGLVSSPADGSYWSRTAYSTDYAYFLDFFNNNLCPQNRCLKSNGRAVRCVSE